MTAKIQMRVDDDIITKALQVSPALLYEHLRENMFRAFHSHRMYWLSQKPKRFGRGGRGVKVYRVGQQAKRSNRSVHYMLPKQRTVSPRSAPRRLEELNKAAIVTDSAVLRVHQEGATIRAKRRWMTLPVAARPGDLRKWKDKYPERAKRLTRTKKGRNVLIYEITGKRKKRARLRFVQVPRVRNKSTLLFYESWDDLTGRRNREWQVFSNKLLRAMKEAANG